MVEERKKRLHAGLTGLLSSIIICGICVILQMVPFLHIELGADRRRYLLMTFLLSVMGVFIFLAARDRIKNWRIKLPLYIMSFIFVIGIPIIAGVTSGTSSRGWEWALTTFIIGLVPVIFMILGFLVLYGYRFFSLVLFALFATVFVSHIAVMAQLLGFFGNISGPPGFADIFIGALIIILSVVFAVFNLKYHNLNRKAEKPKPHTFMGE